MRNTHKQKIQIITTAPLQLQNANAFKRSLQPQHQQNNNSQNNTQQDKTPSKLRQ